MTLDELADRLSGVRRTGRGLTARCPAHDDTRASLSYKFKNVLMAHARAVLTTDPFVTSDPDLLPLDQVLSKSDLLIVCAPHLAYRVRYVKRSRGGPPKREEPRLLCKP